MSVKEIQTRKHAEIHVSCIHGRKFCTYLPEQLDLNHYSVKYKEISEHKRIRTDEGTIIELIVPNKEILADITEKVLNVTCVNSVRSIIKTPTKRDHV